MSFEMRSSRSSPFPRSSSARSCGAIVTETIFTLDGMGYFFITRLQTNDVYSVMAYVMIVAITVILFNLLADILYGFLDPRIRYD